MWRHIRMTKRGGRSYDDGGIDGTSPGELAILCPACPIPSVNLPPNWQSVGKDSEYVNVLYNFSSSLILFILDTSTTRRLASTPAFDSREGRSRTTAKIQNWVLGLLTSLRGNHIVSIFAALPINKRFVLFVLWCLAWLTCTVNR